MANTPGNIIRHTNSDSIDLQWGRLTVSVSDTTTGVITGGCVVVADEKGGTVTIMSPFVLVWERAD